MRELHDLNKSKFYVSDYHFFANGGKNTQSKTISLNKFRDSFDVALRTSNPDIDLLNNPYISATAFLTTQGQK